MTVFQKGTVNILFESSTASGSAISSEIVIDSDRTPKLPAKSSNDTKKTSKDIKKKEMSGMPETHEKLKDLLEKTDGC